MKTPIFLTTIWFAIAVAAAWCVYATRHALELSGGDFLQAELAIAACLGAFVSATFVVWSYLQTNKAFLESLRPQLLIQVVSNKIPRARLIPR